MAFRGRRVADGVHDSLLVVSGVIEMSRRFMPHQLFVSFVAVALVTTACAGLRATEPNEAGEVVVTLTDNAISPSVIRVEAGDRVRLVIENRGRHPHEFMVGRNPVAFDNYLDLGTPVYEPFETDFFAGLDVNVTGTGMAMNFAGMAGMDMGAEGEMGHDGDGGMDMGAEGEVHHGAMVMLQPGAPGSSRPGQVSVIEFVVPEDRAGTWQIGCFQEAGQHYEDGMRATLIVDA